MSKYLTNYGKFRSKKGSKENTIVWLYLLMLEVSQLVCEPSTTVPYSPLVLLNINNINIVLQVNKEKY